MTNAVNIPRLLSLWILSLFVAVSSVWAVDPSRPGSSYIRDRFTDKDGLYQNVVNEMLQSRDGFLWLAAGTLLIRFDGRHFTQFYHPPQVRALVLAPDGALWLGTPQDLERIPAATLNQFDPLPATSYHPGPGL